MFKLYLELKLGCFFTKVVNDKFYYLDISMELDRNLLLFLGESPKPNDAFSFTVGIPKNKMSYPNDDFFFPLMGLMDTVF